MSIRLRFTLALTAIGVVLFGTYAVWAYFSERHDLQVSAMKETRLIGQSLEKALGNALRDRKRADIDEILASLEALAPAIDIHMHDPHGTSIAHSHGAIPDEAIEQQIDRSARTGAEILAFESDDDPHRLVFTGPLLGDDGALLGVVAVSRPGNDMKADLERTRDRLILALSAFLIATMIAGLILGTVQVSRPIARLLAGVRQVREGDFKVRVGQSSHDEIGELVDEFNMMIATLAETRARTEAEADARARLERGLQRVDKLVTIGQLSAGLAHEIGSPLQVLSGRAAALVDHADPEVRRQAQLLVGQCERITRVIEQLLSFGRRKQATTGPCDLHTPVQAVFDLMAGEARRRGVKLELVADQGSHAITADVDQLQQVTLNLVRNALNATPAGGTITVRIDRADGKVRLSVKDTGPGIDTETRGKLFEPFFTTRSSEGGTGLGLAVVRAIANEHHATIDVISEPGHGAEFVVSFPYRSEDSHG